MPQMIFCDCGQNTEVIGTEDTKQTVVIEPDSCNACRSKLYESLDNWDHGGDPRGPLPN